MEVKEDCIREFKDRTIPGSLKAAVWAYRVSDTWRDRSKLLDILLVAKQPIFISCKTPLDASVTPPMQDRLS